jgi:hypothetical protein
MRTGEKSPQRVVSVGDVRRRKSRRTCSVCQALSDGDRQLVVHEGFVRQFL